MWLSEQVEELFPGVAEHPARGLIHVEKPPRVRFHHEDRLPRLVQKLAEPLTLEIAAFPRHDLVEDRHDVLFVVVQVFQGPGGLNGGPDGAFEAVGVELGFVPIELLRKGDNGLSVQRMSGLTLQILENPPKLPQMSEIIIQNPPPDERQPRSRGPHRTRPPADSTCTAMTRRGRTRILSPMHRPGRRRAPSPSPPNGNEPARMYLDRPPGINLHSGGADR